MPIINCTPYKAPPSFVIYRTSWAMFNNGQATFDYQGAPTLLGTASTGNQTLTKPFPIGTPVSNSGYRSYVSGDLILLEAEAQAMISAFNTMTGGQQTYNFSTTQYSSYFNVQGVPKRFRRFNNSGTYLQIYLEV